MSVSSASNTLDQSRAQVTFGAELSKMLEVFDYVEMHGDNDLTFGLPRFVNDDAFVCMNVVPCQANTITEARPKEVTEENQGLPFERWRSVNQFLNLFLGEQVPFRGRHLRLLNRIDRIFDDDADLP